MANAGGAATNTGIDYQQRLSAYFLIQMLLEADSLSGIGLDGTYHVIEVSLESSACIDDIVIKTTTGTLYIQAKRNISMSDASDSEFQKVIGQFVNQYLVNPGANDKYVLATSSTASSRIRLDLRKILESVRLNDSGFKNNPLSKSEKEVYKKLKSCISASHMNQTNNDISDMALTNILKKIYIAIADVQQGLPLESALLLSLTSKSRIKPELLLSATISLAITLASRRQSINKSGLKSKLGNYFGPLTQENKKAIEQNFFKLQFLEDISCGRELLLIESSLEEADFMIAEIIRFDDTGNRRVKFRGDGCELQNGITWKVLNRAATYAGIERYIEENSEKFKDKKIVFLPANTDDDVENSAFALAHRDLCLNMLRDNVQPLRCQHCGNDISENGAPLVEVDIEGNEHNIGLVHKKCLRPLDRVIGLIKAKVFDEYSYLKDFDYQTWSRAVQRGQALFKALEGKPKQVMVMGWHPEGASEFKGKYCVKIELKDGSSRYVHHRGKVVRETLESATEKAAFFNASFKENKQKGDPSCYTSRSETFSCYSIALKMIDDEEEECIECIHAEVTEYTLAIEKAYSQFLNYYAPVIILLDNKEGQPIVIRDSLFVISDPLKLNTFIENWAKSGIELPEYTIEIIENDHEFDVLMSKFIQRRVKVVANPIFDMNHNPISGIVFRHFDEIVSQKQEE